MNTFDSLSSEELTDVSAANTTFLNSVFKLSTKLTCDVSRPLLEKHTAGLVPSTSGTSPTSSSSSPVVCPRCYTPQSAGMLRSQLLACYRKPRSVRHLTAKKRSILQQLSTRERMMVDSHNQWSNILHTRCRVCGLKTRQLCPLPGQRPVPSSSCQITKKPDALQLMVATLNAATPSKKKKKKKNKNNNSECGLVLSEELKQEIQMTMGVHQNSSTKKKRKSSVQVADFKSNVFASPCLNDTAKEVIGLDCVDTNETVSDKDLMLKSSQETPKSASRHSAQTKKISNSKMSTPINTPVADNIPKSKQTPKVEQKCLKQTPSPSPKLMNKSFPTVKKVLSDVTTPPASKKMKSDKVSMIDQDNIAQYGVPLLRINEVKKTQNVWKMQQKSNALKSAFKQSMPLKSSKSIKDFLNTLF